MNVSDQNLEGDVDALWAKYLKIVLVKEKYQAEHKSHTEYSQDTEMTRVSCAKARTEKRPFLSGSVPEEEMRIRTKRSIAAKEVKCM